MQGLNTCRANRRRYLSQRKVNPARPRDRLLKAGNLPRWSHSRSAESAIQMAGRPPHGDRPQAGEPEAATRARFCAGRDREGKSRDMVGRREGEKKARGRNRITGNLSVRSRPLAPPQHHPRIAIAGDIPPGSCKSPRRQIDYTKAGAASTSRGTRVGGSRNERSDRPGRAASRTLPAPASDRDCNGAARTAIADESPRACRPRLQVLRLAFAGFI
jgi:hypothetical protein